MKLYCGLEIIAAVVAVKAVGLFCYKCGKTCLCKIKGVFRG